MTTEPTPRYLIVRSLKDGAPVHTVDVTGKSDREVDRVMRGMLINMSDAYFVQDSKEQRS